MVQEVAILGAGNGGCAAAADLGSRGYEVRLYTRSAERLRPLIERGGVQMRGTLGDAFVPIAVMTNSIEEAVDAARVVMICVPVSAHPFFASALAPVLMPEQVVFLNPGHFGGGLFLAHEINRLTGRRDVRTCEVTTLAYGCRLKGPATVDINHIVKNLAFAAFPGKFQAELFDVIKTLYPEIVQATSVLETGFLDINAVEHPPQIICNAGWVEHTQGEYLFYHHGTTRSVGKVIDAVDRERLAIAAAAGIPAKPFVQYFCESGYTSERAVRIGTAYAALQDSEPNRWIKGPKSLDSRYIHEDVGWGLVPWAEMGGVLGVPTPVIDSMITLGSVMNQIDYRTVGLTLGKLGLEGTDLTELDGFLREGIAGAASNTAG